MKRITFIALLLCFIGSNAFAQSITSGVTTGATSPYNGTIYNGPCWVTGATVICNGTTDTDLWVLDSGVTKAVIRAEGSTMPSYRQDFKKPIYMNNNCEIRIIGTSGRAIIEYIPR